MADYCSLCGEKLSFFGGKLLICANQEERLCNGCYDKLDRMENLERGKYLLEHGTPDEPEKMKAFITLYEERTKQKLTYEPPSRPCPNCGSKMERKLKDFTIGAYGDRLFGERYDIDLYACPACGKVEMYTANFAAIKRKQELNEKEVVCSCGTRHSSLVECPTCSFHCRSETPPAAPEKSRHEEKPPWER